MTVRQVTITGRGGVEAFDSTGEPILLSRVGALQWTPTGKPWRITMLAEVRDDEGEDLDYLGRVVAEAHRTSVDRAVLSVVTRTVHQWTEGQLDPSEALEAIAASLRRRTSVGSTMEDT